MGKSEAMISPEEYEALPASIRKKYFSSQERLQIARQYAVQSRKRQRKKSWLAPPTPERASCEAPIETGPRTIALPQYSHDPRLTAVQEVIPENDALWFLSLPEKVKRRQFSQEEQVLLTERCENTLRSAPPKIAFNPYQKTLLGEGEEATHCLPHRRSSVPSLAIDEEALEALASAAETFSLGGQDADDEGGMAIFNLYTKIWSNTTSIQPEMPPPPPPVAPVFELPKPHTKRSFRRSFALKPIPLPAPILAPFSSPPPTAILSDQPGRLRRHRTEPNFSLPILSPSATHYQDPSARATLQILASPQAFDEVVEYGFPSPSQNLPEHSFELTRSYSLTFSTSSGDESSTSADSPATPTSVHQAPGTTHCFASDSFSSGPSLPLQQAPIHDPKIAEHNTLPPVALNVYPGDREMTLHMTLTRPDLREPGKNLYSLAATSAAVASSPVLVQQDPLALDKLPVCDDATGSHGAFAVKDDGSGMTLGLKKAWKNIRGR